MCTTQSVILIELSTYKNFQKKFTDEQGGRLGILLILVVLNNIFQEDEEKKSPAPLFLT